MNEDGVRFKSKLDWWLAAACCWPLLFAPFAAMQVESPSVIGVLLIMLIPVGLFVWMLYSTVYVVSSATLTARCLTVTRRVPLQSITALRPSRNPISAPALSFDRVEVVHGDGTLLISPADKAGFVQTILELVPAVTVEGLPVNTDESDAVTATRGVGKRQISVPAVTAPLLVTLLVLAAVLSILTWVPISHYPPDVVVTDGRLIVSGRYDFDVALAAITDVSLEHEMPIPERRLFGSSAGGVRRGRFRVEALGEGVMFTRAGSPPYLLVRTADTFLIINHEDADQTRALHAELTAILRNRE